MRLVRSWVSGQRLQLHDKLPRTLQLYNRYFDMRPGRDLLDNWRAACEGIAQSKREESPEVAPFWYPFLMVWQLAECRTLLSCGDARTILIGLMETRFRLTTESYQDLTQFPKDGFLSPSRVSSILMSGLTTDYDSKPDVELPSSVDALAGMDWRYMFTKIVGCARLPLLIYHHLFADDSIVYYRSLEYIIEAVDAIPQEFGHRSAELREKLVATSSSLYDAGRWSVPSDLLVYFKYHDWIFEAITQIYSSSNVSKWCLAGAKSLMERLATQCLDKFDECQKRKIKMWHSKLGTQASYQLINPLDNVQLPGIADRPIVDTRVEEVTAQDGSASWANRHLYCP